SMPTGSEWPAGLVIHAAFGPPHAARLLTLGAIANLKACLQRGIARPAHVGLYRAPHAIGGILCPFRGFCRQLLYCAAESIQRLARLLLGLIGRIANAIGERNGRHYGETHEQYRDPTSHSPTSTRAHGPVCPHLINLRRIRNPKMHPAHWPSL